MTIMNDYHKNSILRGAVLFIAALAVFFGIICFINSPWWAIPLPLAAIGYGVYNFVKRYFPKDDDKKEDER